MEKKLYYSIKKPVDLSNLPEISGYDFDKGVDFDRIVKSFSTSGIQAANLGSAISTLNTVIRENVPVFLGFTSNMISSGMREIIKYLVKNKKVAVLCTSAGGVEEDAIKANLPFRVGNFDSKGDILFDAGVGRIGNIYTTNEHYANFEKFIRKVFEFLMKEETVITPTRICWMMGKVMEEEEEYNHNSSYLYWAYKHNIPVYCPGIIDGAIGDIVYFLRKKYPKLIIDVAKDHEKLIDYTMNCERTAAVILGGGLPKHYVLNANIFKEGLDYAVYISTATEHDASDSGGNIEEAISWAKIKPNAISVKVNSEASIVFPILVGATWAKE